MHTKTDVELKEILISTAFSSEDPKSNHIFGEALKAYADRHHEGGQLQVIAAINDVLEDGLKTSLGRGLTRMAFDELMSKLTKKLRLL